MGTMDFISDTTSNGVSERLFTVGDIPGVLWTPGGAAGGLPLVLMGHGGGGHKKAEHLVTRALGLAAAGFAVAAIDAPGHGGRPRTADDERLIADARARIAAGEPMAPLAAHLNEVMAARAVPEWQATLDALQKVGFDGPVGYSGLSMGTGIGVPFVAGEPRIAAAIFGLAGGESLAETAARITVPIQFLLQWDDQLVSRELGFALFDAFASREKSLHANPGPHAAIPEYELDSSMRFFARHLMS